MLYLTERVYNNQRPYYIHCPTMFAKGTSVNAKFQYKVYTVSHSQPNICCVHFEHRYDYDYNNRNETFVWWTPCSLIHWKKWYPSLFSSLKMTPFFEAKHWLFSSKWPLFHDKTLTFQSKITPFFVVKHWLFSPNELFFMVKHWTSNLTLFSQNSQRWVPKYPLFLGECESWNSLKNTPLFVNFRTRIRVVK